MCFVGLAWGTRLADHTHYRCKHNDTCPTNALPFATYPIDVGLCCNCHEWMPFDVDHVWIVHPTSFGGCLCTLLLAESKTYTMIMNDLILTSVDVVLCCSCHEWIPFANWSHLNYRFWWITKTCSDLHNCDCCRVLTQMRNNHFLVVAIWVLLSFCLPPLLPSLQARSQNFWRGVLNCATKIFTN